MSDTTAPPSPRDDSAGPPESGVSPEGDDSGPIRPHAPWGSPLPSPPGAVVEGRDDQLAHAVDRRRGLTVHYQPTGASDLGLTLGYQPGAWPPSPTEGRPWDGIDCGPLGFALNAVVLGPAPERIEWGTTARRVAVEVDGKRAFTGRATTIVVMNGQFLHGYDLVPRGHPADGTIEVQVYALLRSERKGMRQRLPRGAHVPHPRIRELRGREVRITSRGLWPLELDGASGGATDELIVRVVPGACTLAV